LGKTKLKSARFWSNFIPSLHKITTVRRITRRLTPYRGRYRLARPHCKYLRAF
jgi:hypothetical protein